MQPSEHDSPSSYPCPICGSQNFSWGRTVLEANNWLFFRQKAEGWGEGEKLYARKCKGCSNVQLFTQPHLPSS